MTNETALHFQNTRAHKNSGKNSREVNIDVVMVSMELQKKKYVGQSGVWSCAAVVETEMMLSVVLRLFVVVGAKSNKRRRLFWAPCYL
jgi:hypothetical protein